VAVNQKLIDGLARALRNARPDGLGAPGALTTEELRQWETDVRAIQVALSGHYGWHFQWAAFSSSVRRPKDAGADDA
jgi:hypothetical protein